MRGSVALIYEESTVLHPENSSVVEKIKDALLTKPGKEARGLAGAPFDNPRVQRIIQTMEDYFGR
jgi:hypothetical protein